MLAGRAILPAEGPDAATYVVVCVALILVIIVIGAVVIPWIKRRYAGGGEVSGPEQGFSIEHLQRMHDSGEISREEFRRLRRAALGLEAETAKTDNSPSSWPSADDDDVCAGDPGAEDGAEKERE